MNTTMEYSIGYRESKILAKLATTETEKATLRRLSEFHGTASDLETAAEIYDRAGKSAMADEIRALREA